MKEQQFLILIFLPIMEFCQLTNTGPTGCSYDRTEDNIILESECLRVETEGTGDDITVKRTCKNYAKCDFLDNCVDLTYRWSDIRYNKTFRANKKQFGKSVFSVERFLQGKLKKNYLTVIYILDFYNER